jgi:4-hydroxymandelate oxidase
MNRRHFLQNSGTVLAASLLAGGAHAATPTPAIPMKDLSDLTNVFEVEERARRLMGDPLYDYVASGAADEITLRWNIEKYRELKLRPRALQDVTKLDTRLTLFGQSLTMPMLLAPTANHRLVHPEGEIATARGAALASAAMILSSGANTDIREVIAATNQPVWFQLYIQNDRAVTKDIIRHAEDAGAKVLVITVDSPVNGSRNREKRAGIKLPPGIGHPNYLGRAQPRSIETLEEVRPQKLDWAEMEWLMSQARIPVVLKGILTADDADHAIKVGAAGIGVSNHGGRALDTVPATIEALPAVVDRVAGRVPVLVDGGIRRGTDVLKALACGAQAVLVGRPYVYGLAVGGAEGVAHVMKTLRLEFLQAMALAGRPTLKSIDKSVLW